MLLFYCSSSSAEVSLPTSPTSPGRPASPTSVNLSSPECTGHAELPAVSRNHAEEDKEICESLEFSSEFWKVVTDIQGLVEERRDGADTAGTDASSVLKDDVIHLPYTNDDEQVRDDDVIMSSQGDVAGQQDAVSIEKDKQVCDGDTLCPSNDDDAAVVFSGVKAQSPSPRWQAQLISPADNGETGVRPTNNRPTVDEPAQSSPGEVVKQSLRFDDEVAAEYDDSVQRTVMDKPSQVQSRDHHPPPDAERAFSCSLPSQTYDLVTEIQSSDSPITSSRDLITSHSALTVSSEFTHERSLSEDDCSDVERVRRIDESRLDRSALTDNQSEKTHRDLRDVSQSASESDVSVDDQQSLFNEDASENSVAGECRTFATSAADRCASSDTRLSLSATVSSTSETVKRSLRQADDEADSDSATNSYHVAQHLAEFTADDCACDKSRDLKADNVEAVTREYLEDAEDAPGLEETNLLLANNSSNPLYCLDTTDVVNDEDSSNENSPTLKASFFYQLDQTVAAASTSLTSSSSSGSSPEPAVNDEIAAAELNDTNTHRTLTAASEDTRPSRRDVKISLHLPPTPSPPPPPPSSPVAGNVDVNGFGLGENCRRQREETTHADAVTNETDAEMLSSSESSLLSPSMSSSVDNHIIKSSESHRSAARDGRGFNAASDDTVFQRQPDNRNDLEDVTLACCGTAVDRNQGSGDIDVVEKTYSTAILSDNCLVSEMSSLQQLGDIGTDTKFADHPPLNAMSITQHAVAPPTDRSSTACAKNISQNGSVQTHSILRTSTTTTSEAERKAERTENKRNYVDVRRKRQTEERERDETMQSELEKDVKDQPPLLLSPPPPELMTHFSGDDINCRVDDSLHLEGKSTKTQRQPVHSSRKTFTSISTVYCQPPALKDVAMVRTLNGNIRNDTGVSPSFQAVERKDRRSAAVEQSFPNTSSRDQLVASSKTRNPAVTVIKTDSKMKSDNCQTKERRAKSASTGNDLLASAIKTNSTVVMNKSENFDDSRRTSLRNDMVSSPTSVVVRRISQTYQPPPSKHNDPAVYFGTSTQPLTTISVAKRHERGPPADTVTFRRANDSFSAAPNRIHDADEFRNVHHQRPLSATADNADRSAIDDRIRADKKEQARVRLQSFLAPLCNNASRTEPPVDSRNLKWRCKVAVEPITRRSHQFDDISRDGATGSQDENIDKNLDHHTRRPSHGLTSTASRLSVITTAQSRDFRDDNNNDDGDVIKMASPTSMRSQGDESSRQVRYSVALTLRSMSDPPTVDSRNNRRHLTSHRPPDGAVVRDVTTFGTSSLDRSGVRPHAVFRRSLSVPVVDRPEAFIVSPATACDRDRVMLPQTVRHLPMSPPPTRLSSSRSLGVVREY